MSRVITKDGHKGIDTFIGIQWMIWMEDMVRDIIEFGDGDIQKMSSAEIAQKILNPSTEHSKYGIFDVVESQLISWIDEYRKL